MKIRKNYLPKPEKIFKRGLYEIMWGSANHRQYGGKSAQKKKKR